MLDTTGAIRARRPETSIYGFRADGAWLVVGNAARDGVEEWSPSTGETRPSAFADATRGARAFCLAPDDRHLVVARRDDDGDLVLLSRDTQDEITLESSLSSDVATDCAFSPDGRRVAIAFADGVIVRSIVGEAREMATFPLPTASHLTWSKDGRELSLAGDDEGLIATTRPNRLTVRWRIFDGMTRAALGPTPGAIDRTGGLVGHDGCAWMRVASGDGAWKNFVVTDPNGSCVTSRAKDVMVSPNGHFVAALLRSTDGDSAVVGRAPR